MRHFIEPPSADLLDPLVFDSTHEAGRIRVTPRTLRYVTPGAGLSLQPGDPGSKDLRICPRARIEG